MGLDIRDSFLYLLSNQLKMKAVILAAGDGGRLGMEIPKVLLKIGNEYILDYHIKGLKKIGIEEVVIITGFKSELIEAHITEHNLRNIINIKLVNNDKHDELENGYSVLCSKEAVDSSFLNTSKAFSI